MTQKVSYMAIFAIFWGYFRPPYYTHFLNKNHYFRGESPMLILSSLRSESRDSYLVRIINNYYQDYYYYDDY